MAKYKPVPNVVITIETRGNGFMVIVVQDGERPAEVVFDSFPKLKKYLKNLIPQIVTKEEA